MASEDQTLSALETLRLSATQAYYSISRALRFDKVSALLQRAELSPDSSVYLLGTHYNPSNLSDPQQKRLILSDLAHHFHSIPLMTYRTGFSPLYLGDTPLRTDTGWGCTLRVGQMLVAQALLRHYFGRDWRWPFENDSTVHSGVHGSDTNKNNKNDNTTHIDSCCHPTDTGSHRTPHTIHATSHNTTEECHSSAIKEHELHHDNLYIAQVLQLFWDVPSVTSPFSLHNLCLYGMHCGVSPGRWLGPWTACCALEQASKHIDQPTLSIAVLGGSGGGAPLLYKNAFLDYFASIPSNNNEDETCGLKNKNKGLLLLIPLLLGLSGKLNEVYIPQLLSVFEIPQSVGIIGGRPGSSIYFVGYQGSTILYLDPHQVQPAVTSQHDNDWLSYRVDVLRTFQIENIDPSLALGFYCGSIDEYTDLCDRLQCMESAYARTPLVCVRQGIDPGGGDSCAEQDIDDSWVSESETNESLVLSDVVEDQNDSRGGEVRGKGRESHDERTLEKKSGMKEEKDDDDMEVTRRSSTKSEWDLI